MTEKSAARAGAKRGSDAAVRTSRSKPARRTSTPKRKAAAPTRRRSPLRLVETLEQRKAKGAAASASRSITMLLIPTAFLTVLGLAMILSAGSISAVQGYGSSFWYFNRQLLYALAGVVGLVVAARLSYRVWQKASLVALVAIVPLMLIAIHPERGISLYGASRWIDLGPVTLQPSELLKFALVAFAATVLTNKFRQLDRLRHLLIPLAPVVGFVAVLVLLQRDLGTTVILCGSVFLMMFAAGVRGRYLAVGAMAGIAGVFLMIFGEAYRRTRFVDGFLHAWDDRLGDGYQLVQGLIALGSGGWFGVGLGESRFKWDYLPNAHSDFIFSIIGEELGLIGAFAVIAAFGVLIYAGIRIAISTTDAFGRLLAAGITSWIGLQALINLGAVTGLLPITGVPLPLVSFGGTALVVTLAGVGVLISIARSTVPADTKGSSTDRGRSSKTRRSATSRNGSRR